MKADDVLTLANKAMKARRMLDFEYALMLRAEEVGDTKGLEAAEMSFCRSKESFCTLMECIAIVSRHAANEFRCNGYGRCDV